MVMSKEKPRNEYKGHRYVPKIFGEWDKNFSYEGLSIVTYEGNSYTSKQHVPVGTPITNTIFWVSTGNYNAQIEYYRRDVDDLKDEVLKKTDKEYVDNLLKKKMEHVTLVASEEFGFAGNGMTDDSDAFIRFIEYIKENKITHAHIPATEKGYVLNKTIDIPSNLKLTGNKTKIISSLMPSGSASADLLSIRGINDNVSVSVKQNINIGDVEIYVEDASVFQIGKMIHLTQNGVSNEDKYNMFVSIIEGINYGTNSLILKHPLSHTFKTELFPICRQFTHKENVIIDGFTLDVKHSGQLNLVSSYYASNIIIENIGSTGQGGNVIDIDATVNFEIGHIYAVNSSNRVGGRGYAVNIHSASAEGEIHHIAGNQVRHVVDIAGASRNINVRDCIGSQTNASCYGMHGMSEYNVVFDNCKAYACSIGFGFGNGTYGISGKTIVKNGEARKCGIGYNINLNDNAKLYESVAIDCTDMSFQIDSSSNVVIVDFTSIGRGSVIQRAKNVQVKNLKTYNSDKINSGYRSALQINNECEDITIDGLKTDGNELYSLVVGHITATTLKTKNILVINSTLNKAGAYAVIFGYGLDKVKGNNNIIKGDVLIRDTVTDSAFKYNEINGIIEMLVLENSKNMALIGTTGTFKGNLPVTNLSKGIVIENNYPFVV